MREEDINSGEKEEKNGVERDRGREEERERKREQKLREIGGKERNKEGRGR